MRHIKKYETFLSENTQYQTSITQNKQNDILNRIYFSINIPIKGYDLSYQEFNRFIKDYYSGINTDVVDKIYNQYKKDIDIITDNLNENSTIKNILILATIFILGVSCEKENVHPVIYKDKVTTPPIKNMPPPYPNIPNTPPNNPTDDDNDSSNQFNNENTQYNTNFNKYQFNKLLNTIKFKINIPLKGYDLSYQDFNRFLKDYNTGINTDIVDKIYNQYKKDIDIISDNLNENFTIKNILILATIFILGVGCEKENVDVEPNKVVWEWVDTDSMDSFMGASNNYHNKMYFNNILVNSANHQYILTDYYKDKTPCATIGGLLIYDDNKITYNGQASIDKDNNIAFRLLNSTFIDNIKNKVVYYVDAIIIDVYYDSYKKTIIIDDKRDLYDLVVYGKIIDFKNKYKNTYRIEQEIKYNKDLVFGSAQHICPDIMLYPYFLKKRK